MSKTINLDNLELITVLQLYRNYNYILVRYYNIDQCIILYVENV